MASVIRLNKLITDTTIQVLGGAITINDTTESSSISTGSVIVLGGLGITKNISGTSLSLSGSITSGTWAGTVISVARGGTGLSTLNTSRIPFGAGTSAFNTTSALNYNITTSVLTFPKCISSDTTESTSTVTGAAIFSGGAGFAKSIYYGGTLQNSSDSRLKEVVGTIDNVLDKIDSITPIYFTKIKDEEKKVEIGFLAQEVRDVFPELVSMDEKGYYYMDYSRMTAVLFQCVKELKELKKGKN